MWVTFFRDEASAEDIILSKYQAQDEPVAELLRVFNCAELINVVLEKSSIDTHEIRRRGAVKVDFRLQTFDELVLQPMRRRDSGSRSSTDEISFIFKPLQLQQEQVVQQNQLVTSLISSLNAEKPVPKLLEPDAFDGSSSSPDSWKEFYQYAAVKNKWHSDDDNIYNMRTYLRGVARKWYELRVIEDANNPWNDCNESFLTTFRTNPVKRWDTALKFKFTQARAFAATLCCGSPNNAWTARRSSQASFSHHHHHHYQPV